MGQTQIAVKGDRQHENAQETLLDSCISQQESSSFITRLARYSPLPMEASFRDGSVKTTGTVIDKLLAPMSRFGGGNRAEKKQGVIDKLKGFFERFFGIG